MPPHAIHCMIDKALFGEEFLDIHRNKDNAIKNWGSIHRIIGHDPFYNLQTRFPPSAFAHDLADALTFPITPLLFIIDQKLVID